MTLEQKNELELYAITIANRLKTLGIADDGLDLNPEQPTIVDAVDDLESILIKTQYLLDKFNRLRLKDFERSA